MNLIEQFQINKNQHIDILIPDLKDKFNFYYDPANDLNKFDEVFVLLKGKNNKTEIVGQDMADMIISSFQEILTRVLNNKAILLNDIEPGKLGYQYSIEARKSDDEEWDYYADYSIWSGGFATKENMQRVWMYNYDNKIYLEVSPIYPWLYEESEKDEKIVNFKDFAKSCKPILVQEISKETAQKWLSKCNKILEKMAKP